MKQIQLSRWALAPVLVLLGSTLACTVPVEEPLVPPVSPGVPPASPTVADPATLLLPLSPQVLQQKNAELTERIDSELALAGLGKITRLGAPISPDLEAFRLSWAETDPAIAPFLGTWVHNWNLMPYDFMTVLPSTVPGQVCLVRYRQTETETVPFETFTTPIEVSVARVVDGQLLGEAMQTADSFLRFTQASAYVTYDIAKPTALWHSPD